MMANARPGSAADQVIAQIHALESLGIKALRARWAEVHGAPPSTRWNRALLVRGLAHRLQEEALGGLAPALRAHLTELAARLAKDPDAPLTAPPQIKPGTRLIRAWHGERHQVTVLEDGFDYRGKHYRSLSAIAHAITGTRWSGPAFFGLRTRRRVNGTCHG
jgi:Protein of unknown function (DUF2924)